MKILHCFIMVMQMPFLDTYQLKYVVYWFSLNPFLTTSVERGETTPANLVLCKSTGKCSFHRALELQLPGSEKGSPHKPQGWIPVVLICPTDWISWRSSRGSGGRSPPGSTQQTRAAAWAGTWLCICTLGFWATEEFCLCSQPLVPAVPAEQVLAQLPATMPNQALLRIKHSWI